MELDEFIQKTLVSIRKGILGANQEIASAEGKKIGQNQPPYYGMNPRDGKDGGHISFDVAVTVTQETNKSGTGGIKVSVVNLGRERINKDVFEHVSRIKFNVKIEDFIG